MSLDEIKQLFLGLKVVVQPGQRHAARSRQIAHGRTLVPLLVENVGRVGKNLAKSLIKTALRLNRPRAAHWGSPARACCGKSRHKIERSFGFFHYKPRVTAITRACDGKLMSATTGRNPSV